MALPQPDLQAQYAAQQRRQRTWFAIGGATAVVAAALIGLVASGALQFGAKSPEGKTLQARGTAPETGLLAMEAKPPAPTLQATDEAPAEMPADVLAYLQHIEKCEKEKANITGDQLADATVLMQQNQALGAAMGLMDPYDQSEGSSEDKSPSDYTKGKMLDFRPRWTELYDFFRSVPPPDECRELADDYDRAISEIPAMMGDLGSVLNDATGNPAAAIQSLEKLKGRSSSGIDRFFARSDQKLGDICGKYHKPKWFNIKTDVGSGGLLGKLNGL
ncbi:hypothetical protein EON81_01430 [bacterium]|nr:MAG: hypothetical protein EON81_01430 [bacterium]